MKETINEVLEEIENNLNVSKPNNDHSTNSTDAPI